MSETQQETLNRKFLETTANCVGHCRRSLLDFLDVIDGTLTDEPDNDPTRVAIAMLKKRVHNDVMIIKDQVEAAFRIYLSGGVIPPFGRPDDGRGNGPQGHRAPYPPRPR